MNDSDPDPLGNVLPTTTAPKPTVVGSPIVSAPKRKAEPYQLKADRNTTSVSAQQSPIELSKQEAKIAAEHLLQDEIARDDLAELLVTATNAEPRLRRSFLRATSGEKGDSARKALQHVVKPESDVDLRRGAQNLGAGQTYPPRRESDGKATAVRDKSTRDLPTSADLAAGIDELSNKNDVDARIADIQKARLIVGQETNALADATIAAAGSLPALDSTSARATGRKEQVIGSEVKNEVDLARWNAAVDAVKSVVPEAKIDRQLPTTRDNGGLERTIELRRPTVVWTSGPN